MYSIRDIKQAIGIQILKCDSRKFLLFVFQQEFEIVDSR